MLNPSLPGIDHTKINDINEISNLIELMTHYKMTLFMIMHYVFFHSRTLFSCHTSDILIIVELSAQVCSCRLSLPLHVCMNT